MPLHSPDRGTPTPQDTSQAGDAFHNQPAAVEMVPAELRQQFKENMYFLWNSWPQTHGVRKLFLDTCALVSGLQACSDPALLERDEMDFSVHTGNQIGARVRGNMNGNTEIWMKFANRNFPNDSTDMIRIRRRAADQEVMLDLIFSQSGEFERMSLHSYDEEFDGSFGVDKHGIVTEFTSGLHALRAKHVNIPSLITTVMAEGNSEQPLNMHALVQDSLSV